MSKQHHASPIDWERLSSWALDPKRKPAIVQFTASDERNAAYLVEFERQRIIDIAEMMAMSDGGQWRAGLKFLIKRLKDAGTT